MPEDPQDHPASMPGLDHVETWIFDLDNTLYPAECNLFAQIDRRMGGYIGALLGLDPQAARKVQKDFFVSHGTTLRGLMDVHGIAPDEFLRHVHDIDVSPVPPDPRLAAALGALDGRKLVFTNGSASYAGRVLARLGIDHLFDGVFDIVAAAYHPKPRVEAYARFIERYAIEPGRAAMFEDMARNLVPAAELGMTTVWVETPYPWGKVDFREEAIHHRTRDLRGFLEARAGRALP